MTTFVLVHGAWHWQFVSIACGHDVMIDRPQELADILVAAG